MKNELENQGFVHVSNIDVDAGCVWIGDPCYILQDTDSRPSDLGEDWGDISDRFLDRIGYTASMNAYQVYHHRATLAAHGFDPLSENVFNYNHQYLVTIGENGIQGTKVAINNTKVKEYIKENPYVEQHVYHGFAAFRHDGGHEGLGVMTDTNEGDGTYPVYIKYGKNGRPSQVLIDFGDN